MRRDYPVETEYRNCGIGTFCLPRDEEEAERIKELFEMLVQQEDMHILGWKDVQSDAPSYICQAFIEKPKSFRRRADFNRRLGQIRQSFISRTYQAYIPSLSCR